MKLSIDFMIYGLCYEKLKFMSTLEVVNLLYTFKSVHEQKLLSVATKPQFREHSKMFFTLKFLKFCGIFVILLSLLNIFYFYILKNQFSEFVPKALKIGRDNKISWEDRDFINYEKTRVGPGELGKPVVVTDPDELKTNQEWERKEGFYVEVSNQISVSRSLPDFRPKV